MKVRRQGMLAVSTIATAMLAGVSLAQADGVERGARAYAAPFSWTGLYLGGHSGWLGGDISGHFAPVNPAFGFKAEPDDGGIAGLHVGYNYQFGAVVVGVEGGLSGDILGSNDQGAVLGAGLNGPCGFVANVQTCNGRFTQIREIGGRLGWAFGHWLAYGTGGYANARIETWGTSLPSGTKFSVESANHDGWYGGGGVEYALTRHAIVGVEYKHYTFDSEAHRDVASPNNSRVVKGDADAVMARLSFKFGPWSEPAPLK
jgi:outer membrane immunogenic protein